MRCVPQPSSGEVHLRTVVVFSSSEGGPSGRRLTASISQTSASTSVGKAAATLPVQSCVSSTERSRPSLRMSPSADSGPAGFSKCCSLSTVDTTHCTGSLESTANMRALSGRTSVTCTASQASSHTLGCPPPRSDAEQLELFEPGNVERRLLVTESCCLIAACTCRTTEDLSKRLTHSGRSTKMSMHAQRNATLDLDSTSFTHIGRASQNASAAPHFQAVTLLRATCSSCTTWRINEP